jgi:hypothetical protein
MAGDDVLAMDLLKIRYKVAAPQIPNCGSCGVELNDRISYADSITCGSTIWNDGLPVRYYPLAWLPEHLGDSPCSSPCSYPDLQPGIKELEIDCGAYQWLW